MIIPSGDEYSYLKKIYLSLKNMGYDEDQMCVLFRVDKEKGKITNDFIKEHSLNNPISEKIKIFFVSVKMPKPLIKNQIEIGTVFNMGAVNAHHTLRNFVNNHHNVLTYKMSVEKDANM
jgi:preprotein translocase subunit SecD